MKRKIPFILAAVIALSVAFTSCKKSNTDVTDNTDLATHADDQSNVAITSDDIANDANTAIDNYVAFNGNGPSTPGGTDGTMGIPCNATVVLDSLNGLRRLTITYNGLNCTLNRIRTGVVVLTMPLTQHWKDAGAQLTINILNLNIKRVIDNVSITINGTAVATNVTGGKLRDLSSLVPLCIRLTARA